MFFYFPRIFFPYSLFLIPFVVALTEFQQLKKLLEDSKHVLLVFNSRDNGDAAAGALVLKKIIEKHKHHAEIACADFKTPKHLQFLPGIGTIKPALGNLQKFIIKVDVSKTPLETLSYDIKNSTLSIYLTPKHGLLSKNELRTAQSTFKYDLIITLNTPDLEALGEIFDHNTDLFYHTPIVVLDKEASNERYGHVNIIDLSAGSACEIIFKIVKHFGEEFINPDLATTILAGMTIASGGFKNPNIQPSTLQTASTLINFGADREKIIQNLYRTRSISTLKLWGEALRHLETDPRLSLVWTTISREDFSRSGGGPEDLPGIIDDLIGNSPEAKIILVLFEIENGGRKVGGLIATDKNYDALKIARSLAATGTSRQAKFTILGKGLKEAEQYAIRVISEGLPK